MVRSETVRLYAVPSTHLATIMGGEAHLDEPYRRIVGIAASNTVADIEWSVINPAMGRVARYVKAEAELITLSTTDDFAQRLGSFFDRYFAERRAQNHGTSFNTENDLYNCHQFAYWMSGRAVCDTALPAPPNEIVRGGFKVGGSLPFGSHGVIGLNHEDSDYDIAWHSIVGLGEDSSDCLQVLSTGGFLGLDTYDQVLGFYRRGDEGTGLYTHNGQTASAA